MTAIIVSSRAPVWGASVFPVPVTASGEFQVVPPCGGHLVEEACGPLIQEVSSRAPVWGASRATFSGYRKYEFQVVPPCGGHQKHNIYNMIHIVFQVVPPCGGHLGQSLERGFLIRVSSRAPVWGASSVYHFTTRKYLVSSRAPVWGASKSRQVQKM